MLKVCAQKKIFEENNCLRFAETFSTKHFLQWYLFAVCGNIFYSGIYWRRWEFKLKSSCTEKFLSSFWREQLFAVTEIFSTVEFICGKTSCWKVCEQKKVFEENSCLRLTETFSTVVFICEENSYWKVCAQKKVFKEIVVCVETFSTVVFLCRKFFSWGFPFCWTILLAEW